ncbi:MAG TPA: TonB-dependent receptor plug domain-containing protein, partial [Phenylobacterium sp.]
MGEKFVGVRAYARKHPVAGSRTALALAGAAALGVFHPAWAADAVADDARQLSPVDVEGKSRPLDADTGVPTMLTTVQDTPQAINVIDAAQLRAQGVNTLEQALRQVPGITVAIGEGGQLNGDQFKIRGFDSKDDVYVDGLRDFGVYTRDSFNYEEVQVLKGPSGAMFGRGATGGAINTISKRPHLENTQSVDLYAGNGDYYRALADINHQLGETSAVRLSLMGSSTGVVDRDLIKSERWGAAATVAFGIGTDTQVSVGYVHQYDKRRPDYGIIIVQRPGDLIAKPATAYDIGVDRSNFLGFRDDTDRSKADILTVRVTHKVNEKVTLTSDTRYGVYSRYFQYSTLDQCNAACTTALFDGNPATEAFGGIGGSSPYDQDSWGLQNISTARVDYDLGPFRNQAIIGVDLSRQENDKNFYAYTLPAGIATRPNIPHPIVTPNPNFPAGYGVFRPVPGANLTCPATGNCTTGILGGTVFSNVAGTGTLESHGESTDVGLFVTDRLWLTEQVSIIGSLRMDRYIADLGTTTYAGAESPPGGIKVKSRLWSPRVSA